MQDDEASAVSAAGEPHLAAAAELLGCDREGLRKALTTRTRHVVDGAIVSPLDPKTAAQNRDSLAKVRRRACSAFGCNSLPLGTC